jgi:regulatory protein
MSEIESVHALNEDLFRKEEVERFSNPLEARKKAMDYLARREYGQQELEQKLMTAGFDPAIAAAAVEKLTDEGLQDDRRFVVSFTRTRINQGKGPVRIRLELRQCGLDQSLVAEILDDVGEDWFELAKSVRCRKFGEALPRDFREKARQMRFLQYRGFESAHIQSATSSHGDH